MTEEQLKSFQEIAKHISELADHEEQRKLILLNLQVAYETGYDDGRTSAY
jgi:hypothetical protein